MVVLSSVAIGLVAFALRDNINLFYPPADVMAGKAPTDRTIRLGGMVVEGSIERSETELDTTFWVTDYEGSVAVRYSGILPDLFAEGEGVVAEGMLDASRHAGGYAGAGQARRELYASPRWPRRLRVKPHPPRGPRCHDSRAWPCCADHCLCFGDGARRRAVVGHQCGTILPP